MPRPLSAFAAALAALALLPGAAPAQSGTWTQAAAGTHNWSTPANWAGGAVANGAGSAADFTTANRTGPVTVTLDGDRTIGRLLFDNPSNTFPWAIAGSSTLTLDSGPLTVVPSIDVRNANLTAAVGVPLAGTGGLSVTGDGTLVLSAGGTYAGGTGVGPNTTLLVTNTTGSATGTGPVTVSGGPGPLPGGTLGGTGFISGPVTVTFVQGAGTIAPGVGGIGTLTLGSGLTINGIYDAEVTATPANAADLIAVTGNLTLGPSGLRLPDSNTYAPVSANVTYTLITFTGARTGTFGSVSGLPAGYQLVYAANAVQLVPVPEPAGVLLACGAAAGALGWWRRRKA
jgi:hypothetical protein